MSNNKKPVCKCGMKLNDDDIATVHLHLIRAHNMTVGEAAESVSEYITFPDIGVTDEKKCNDCGKEKEWCVICGVSYCIDCEGVHVCGEFE